MEFEPCPRVPKTTIEGQGEIFPYVLEFGAKFIRCMVEELRDVLFPLLFFPFFFGHPVGYSGNDKARSWNNWGDMEYG